MMVLVGTFHKKYEIGLLGNVICNLIYFGLLVHSQEYGIRPSFKLYP